MCRKLNREDGTEMVSETIEAIKNNLNLNISPKSFNEQIPPEIFKSMENEPLTSEADEPLVSKNPQQINDDEIYFGEWNIKNQKHGIGKLINFQNKIYILGKWVNDILVYARVYSDEGQYEGNIKDNNFNGKGKFIYKNIGVYEGDWVDGKKNGKGVLNYSDGSIYTGDFTDDKKEGEGVINWKNGYYYSGHFVNNLMNGKGTLSNDNESYVGDFHNGMFSGVGKYSWIKNNEYYEGEYAFNKKEGKGEFHFRNGNVFKGNWMCNMPHGEGTFETKNKIYKCNYKGGIPTLIEVIKKNDEDEDLDLNFEAPKEGLDITKLKHLNISLYNLNMSGGAGSFSEIIN